MKRLTTNQIIERFQAKHGSRYDYCDVVYEHAKQKVAIRCRKHGIFYMTPNNHLYAGQGCPQCGDEATRSSTADFIREASKVHNSYYDYSKVVYRGTRHKVEIVCPVHGSFRQTADQHKNSATGCPKCTYDHYVGGYSVEYFQEHSEAKVLPGNLYLVRLLTSNESPFYKVGITRRTIASRFSGYDCDVIPVHTEVMPLLEAFTKEQAAIKTFYGWRYYPKMRFKGWTECFQMSTEQTDEMKAFLFD